MKSVRQVFTSMWSKEKAKTFLVGVDTGMTILENCIVPKLKVHILKDRDLLSWFMYTNRKVFIWAPKSRYRHVHSSIIYFSSKLEATQMPIDYRKHTQVVAEAFTRYHKGRKMHQQLLQATTRTNLTNRLLGKEARHRRSHTEFTKGKSNLQC